MIRFVNKNTEEYYYHRESIKILLFGVITATILGISYWFLRLGFDYNTFWDVVKSLSLGYIILLSPYFIKNFLCQKKIIKKGNWYCSTSIISLLILTILFILGYLSVVFSFSFTYFIVLIGIALLILLLYKYVSEFFQRKDVFLLILFFLISLCFTFFIWGEEYINPLFIERILLGIAHQDTLWHVSISNLIKTYNFPTTGLDGIPFLHYHWGSHWLYASLSYLIGFNSLQFYNLGSAVIFMPFMLINFFLIIIDFQLYKRLKPQIHPVIYLITFISIIGLLPARINDYPEFRNFLLISESYVFALGITFLLFSIILQYLNVRSELQLNKKQDYLLFYFILPVFILALIFIKVSVSYLITGLIIYLFFRFEWYKSKRFIWAFATSIIIFFLGYSFRFDLSIVGMVKVFIAISLLIIGGFFLVKKWWKNLVYLTIILVLFAISLIFVLTKNELTLFYYLKNQINIWWPLYLLLYYLWVWIYLAIFLWQNKIKSFKEFKIQFLQGKTILLEILLVLSFLGFIPGALKNFDHDARYFTDFQKWIALLSIIISISPIIKSKSWSEYYNNLRIFLDNKIKPLFNKNIPLRVRSFTLFKYIPVLAIVIYLVINVSNIYVKQIKQELSANLAIRSRILHTDFNQTSKIRFIQLIKSLHEPYLYKLKVNSNYNFLDLLIKLGKINISEKRETCIYIPKDNKLFWNYPTQLTVSRPFIVTSITGIAMINGLPDNLQNDYGYDLYKDYQSSVRHYDETDLMQIIKEKGFKNVLIIMQDNFVKYLSLDEDTSYSEIYQISKDYVDPGSFIDLDFHSLPDSVLLKAIPTYFEGSGWGLRLVYFPIPLNGIYVHIQYRKVGDTDWIYETSTRPGIFYHTDIKGTAMDGDDKYNLEEGEYEVRIMFEYHNRVGRWINTKVKLKYPQYRVADRSEIRLIPNYIEGYGMGIRVYYNPFSVYALTDIQYRNTKDYNWIYYTANRIGLYNSADIHGNAIYNGNEFNLEPGEYEVRIIYTYMTRTLNWFGGVVTVPPPKNEKTYEISDSSNLKLDAEYWKGVGWGIKMEYPAPGKESLVRIQYRKAGTYAWQWLTSNRSGEDTCAVIIGNEKYYADNHNLESGIYEVRFQTFTRNIYSKWFGGRVEIPYYDSIPETKFIEPYVKNDSIVRVYPMYYDEGYGWGILVVHPIIRDSVLIDMQYLHENMNEWKTYVVDRPGEYGFIDIHGYNTFEKDKRNLQPGKYQIRLRFKNTRFGEQWFGCETRIPNYYLEPKKRLLDIYYNNRSELLMKNDTSGDIQHIEEVKVNPKMNYRNDTIMKAFPKYYEGYGWGISVEYTVPDDSAKVDVEYFKEGMTEWKNYVTDRPGQYFSVDIHGYETYNEDKRNLLPGTYHVRIRIKGSGLNEEWMGHEVVIPDYLKIRREKSLKKLQNQYLHG